MFLLCFEFWRRCIAKHYEALHVPKPVQVHSLFHNAGARYIRYFIMQVQGTPVISQCTAKVHSLFHSASQCNSELSAEVRAPPSARYPKIQGGLE